MYDVKWIKIVTDIFDDEKMLLIDSMPEHDGIIVIWFKLLCFAGKQNNGGVLMMNEKIKYTDEMLATIFRRPLNTVRLALNTFQKFGMIELYDGAIAISNWEKHQSLGTLEQRREYMKNYMADKRNKQKEIAEKNVNLTAANKKLTVNYAEEEGEEERDKDIDTTTTQPRSGVQCPFEKIKSLYLSICKSFPAIKAIDGSRRTAVAARWRSYKSIDAFKQLFEIAESSAFLKGKNERNWSADFDWLINAANMAKVLEHKYDDKSPAKKQEGSFDTNEFFNAALARSIQNMSVGGKNGHSE